MSSSRTSGVGLSCLAVSGMLWGTSGLIGTLLNRTADLAPVAVAAYRLSMGGTLIVLSIVLTGGMARVPRGRSAWVRIALMAALAAMFQGCYFAAVSLTSVSLATLITIGASPVLVVTAERLTGRRRGGARMLGAVVLALAGLGLLVGLPSGGFGTSAVLATAGLSLLAAAGFATIAIVGATPVSGVDDLSTVGFGFAAGGLLLMLIATTTTGLTFTPNVAAVCLLIALGTAPTAIAYPLFLRGLRVTGAGTAAIMALLEPLTGTLLAVLLLGDRLGPTGIAGALMLFAAMIMASTPGGWNRRPRGA